MSEFPYRKPFTDEPAKMRLPDALESPQPEKWTAAKFWVALLMAVLSTAGTVFTEGQLAKIISIAGLFLSAIFVYLWPNERKDPR